MKKIILALFVLCYGISIKAQNLCICNLSNNKLVCSQAAPTGTDCIQADKRYVLIRKSTQVKVQIQIDAFSSIFEIAEADLQGQFAFSEITKITRYSCKYPPLPSDQGDECKVPIIAGLQVLNENTSSNLRFDKNANEVVYVSNTNFSKAKMVNSNGVVVKTFASLIKKSQSDFRLNVSDLSGGLYIVIFDDEVNVGKILVY